MDSSNQNTQYLDVKKLWTTTCEKYKHTGLSEPSSHQY